MARITRLVGRERGLGPFANQLPDSLADELDAASRLKIRPMSPGDPGFDEFVRSNSDEALNWAVSDGGELRFAPSAINGSPINHTVLTGGQPVMAAGQARLAAWNNSVWLLDIDNQSGHYWPTQESLVKVGIPAFRDAGINWSR